MKHLFLALCLLTWPASLPALEGMPDGDTASTGEYSRELVPLERADTFAVRRRHFLTRSGPGWPELEQSMTAARDPFDLTIATRLRESALHGSGIARTTAGVFRLAGLPGTILLAGALYGAGEVMDREELIDLGLHAGQAIMIAGGATLAGKVLTGRARPRTSPSNPYDMKLGRGLSGDRFQSFPSAHTAAAFATASVLSTELSQRSRGVGIWVYPASYGAAMLAGTSRLFHDEHWATDVIAGALIGVAAGWFVVEHHRGPAE